MKWLRKHFFEWQFYWNQWYLPWYSKYEDEGYGLFDHYAGIGPLQLHWVTSAIKVDK